MQNLKPTNNTQAARELPRRGNVAIYARVATPAKLTQEKRPVQTDDLITLARQLGYENTHIFVFEQDSGVPGNTAIDERVGLGSLVQAIIKGTIQAVLVADEPRLFRDVTAIQLSLFMKLCFDHNAVVITPEMTYDFHIPLHVKLFRFKCQQAATSIEEVNS